VNQKKLDVTRKYFEPDMEVLVHTVVTNIAPGK